MMLRLPLCALLLILGPACVVAAFEAERLSAEETTAWTRQLMPLPREVELSGKVTVPLARLVVRLPAQPTELDLFLREELSAALGTEAGPGPGGEEAFVLDFDRRASDRDLLEHLRNADQAYHIHATADGEGRVRSLSCGALTDVGSYYGMKTLKQLLLHTLRGEGEAARVEIPVGRIVDWPDLEERGQWGGTAARDMEGLSDLKFNLLEVHASLTVDEDGTPHASMNAELMARARRHAVRIVPIIHHLEQLERTGMFRAFPQLRAVDAETANPNLRSVCFSQPEVVTLLAGWMADLGRVPGVFDVMVWLSEEGKGCGCEGCREEDRFVAELNACVAAWEAARETAPQLGLRVLLSQASYASNDRVLAATPEGVKVSYYHGGLTYNTSRRPMIYPLLEEYVQQGRWMGVYPTLSANWLIVGPFTNPEFVHYRLTEFVDKGLACLVAYIVPTAWYYQVNTAGGLEWAWNAHGRSPREFAVAWATRHGLDDAEKFADWTEIIGPPAWDIYESRFPYLERYHRHTDRIAGGTFKAGLGETILGAFRSDEQFVDNLARCDDALALAIEIGEPQFEYETRIIKGYTQVLQAVRELSKIIRGEDGVRPEDREAAQRWFDVYWEGNEAISTLYPQWSEACMPHLEGPAPARFSATLNIMEELATRMGALMERVGFVDEHKPYRMHRVGGWKTEDFAEERTQVRRLDVSEIVDGPGTYWFRPIYRRGSLGLTASRVALLSFPKDNPQDVREEAVDAHQSHAGAWVQDDVYLLELEQHDPDRGYAVQAHITGGSTTEGEFFFRKLR